MANTRLHLTRTKRRASLATPGKRPRGAWPRIIGEQKRSLRTKQTELAHEADNDGNGGRTSPDMAFGQPGIGSRNPLKRAHLNRPPRARPWWSFRPWHSSSGSRHQNPVSLKGGSASAPSASNLSVIDLTGQRYSRCLSTGVSLILVPAGSSLETGQKCQINRPRQPLSLHPQKTPGRGPTQKRRTTRQTIPGSRSGVSSCHLLSSP